MKRPARNFCDTAKCKCRVHCGACRGNEAWRKKESAPDDCPHGVTIDSLPPRVDVTALAKTRQAVCDECEIDCPIKRDTRCHRKAILNREQFHCPEGKF